MEYICHFCFTNICKPTGWSGSTEYCWQCEYCDTEYCCNKQSTVFPPTHWMAFRCETHFVFVDFLEKTTVLYPLKNDKTLDIIKAITLPYMADVTPNNKDQWLKRILNLKAFL